MNNADENTLQPLKDLNASIKEFNTLLEDLIQYRQKDKLEWLRALNADLREVNTILADILGSRKEDVIINQLHQTDSSSA
jgi:hypothetical protein